MKNIMAMTSLLVLIACGGGEGSDSSKEAGFPAFTLVDPNSSIIPDEDSLSGSGVVKFQDPLPSILSDRHFTLTARVEDGGFVELVIFAKDDLTEGVSFRFSRVNDTDHRVDVFDPSGNVNTDFTQEFEGLSGKLTDEFTVRVDFHNSETDGHLIFWVAEPGVKLKSETPGYNGLLGAQGKGTSWGLRLQDAVVTRARVSGPEVVH